MHLFLVEARGLLLYAGTMQTPVSSRRLIYGMWMALSLMGLAASAKLQWENDELILQVHPAAWSKEVRFVFTNGGTNAVDITRLDSSCGCLVPGIGKKHYEAGESGEIHARLLLSGRSGQVRKHIQVYTSEGTEPYRLDIHAEVPEGYVPSTRRLIWERSPHYESQSCTLVNRFTEPLKLVEAVPSLERIKVQLVPVRPGFEYKLTLTPDDGVADLRGFVRVRMARPQGMERARDYKVYFFIK